MSVKMKIHKQNRITTTKWNLVFFSQVQQDLSGTMWQGQGSSSKAQMNIPFSLLIFHCVYLSLWLYPLQDVIYNKLLTWSACKYPGMNAPVALTNTLICFFSSALWEGRIEWPKSQKIELDFLVNVGVKHYHYMGIKVSMGFWRGPS